MTRCERCYQNQRQNALLERPCKGDGAKEGAKEPGIFEAQGKLYTHAEINGILQCSDGCQVLITFSSQRWAYGSNRTGLGYDQMGSSRSLYE
jgi:hypothetical protein